MNVQIMVVAAFYRTDMKEGCSNRENLVVTHKLVLQAFNHHKL